ncbi:3,4-dihydroxy-2-butanone-4-phosphate synthase [Helicobacter pullorum]|uniref:bifunctional 3,4-dihydroxy-2-butanone 4-phosphate synthase/GTP cyclohydrolase II n=1 Tax=Helicobacter pullorum TaxID=35818 RepID=UPI000816A616|nr:bifunctional 3,4-dihydroxy-2-butanone 4-phosphate synthase/GTP cyclohydrolase II [Helicobacter pullorum]OCR03464.1 3,4-dihydroxy-2-butanone-4-phosphate synthase [Helicobacter pullorum]OCR07670.1 3,4-dihydroxy-2-butanone-4-phosphate synthase [Helicobacter pullorum]OCR09721.1 3,4-dihydroxy-2-butanone-4-phosphate synthase [Helicobacter pullorum]OCR12531.1 3,4-dihydroxy-2-butanone-4-phosphate synthase [Helicobacter pullorum]
METIIRVEEAIKAIKNGEMIIIMDDEDRENEGDLVMAGIFSTPEKINFMAQEARGLICVSITKEIAQSLDLPPMVSNNSSNHETAFTVSIDAKEAKTGISAYERDLTINLMCKANANPNDFVRPGHIFPLIAKEGGVLERTGHTEASVDICRLAGLKPISVICEIMKEDGMMAKRGDRFLSEFSTKHNLKILYVSDLIQYRLKFEKLTTIISQEEVEFFDTKATKIKIKDHLNQIHSIFKFNNPTQKPLVKFHTIKEDLELLENTISFKGLMRSIEILKKEGGYLVFLKTKTSKDIKELGIGAQILKIFEIEDFRLLTTSNFDENECSMLSGFNLKILERIEV